MQWDGQKGKGPTASPRRPILNLFGASARVKSDGRPQEAHFESSWGWDRELAKTDLRGSVLGNFGLGPRNLPKQASGGRF